MECETGIWDADECDDTPDESAPDGCLGIFILSDKQSKCGSSCSSRANQDLISQRKDESLNIKDGKSISANADPVKNYTAWTLWHS